MISSPGIPLQTGVEWFGDVPEHWEVTALAVRFKSPKGVAVIQPRATPHPCPLPPAAVPLSQSLSIEAENRQSLRQSLRQRMAWVIVYLALASALGAQSVATIDTTRMFQTIEGLG